MEVVIIIIIIIITTIIITNVIFSWTQEIPRLISWKDFVDIEDLWKVINLSIRLHGDW